MKNAADIMATHRRLEILRLLNEAAGYSCNEALMADILRQSGFVVSSDMILTDLSWLEEQNLITLKEIGGLHIAKVRNRGVEIAKGIVKHPGIHRPLPGE